MDCVDIAGESAAGSLQVTTHLTFAVPAVLIPCLLGESLSLVPCYVGVLGLAE